MQDVFDLISALKECQESCGESENSLSDVETGARDATEAAETAVEKVRDIENTIDSAIELAKTFRPAGVGHEELIAIEQRLVAVAGSVDEIRNVIAKARGEDDA